MLGLLLALQYECIDKFYMPGITYEYGGDCPDDVACSKRLSGDVIAGIVIACVVVVGVAVFYICYFLVCKKSKKSQTPVQVMAPSRGSDNWNSRLFTEYVLTFLESVLARLSQRANRFSRTHDRLWYILTNVGRTKIQPHAAGDMHSSGRASTPFVKVIVPSSLAFLNSYRWKETGNEVHR